MRRDLSRLLQPRSIAVLGSVWAENVIVQCKKMGFEGQVWPVHPARREVAGLRAYASVADLPEAPDASFIGVNRYATLDVVRELAARGAGGAICFASGWAEVGERALQVELVTAAGAMPVLGPNCYGVINYLDGALLWPDQHGGKRIARGVAILSQSSNIAVNLTMQRRGLPVAYVACLGNAAQITLADLAGALLADPRVTALGLYIEGIADAPAFATLAEAARAAGKGIVALKAGKTELARAAAASHTAALAGLGALSSAFLAQCGVAEVATLAELLETLKIFHVHGPLCGRNICSVACSGGEAGLVADLAARHALTFSHPSQASEARLAEILGPIVPISNPLDYQTFIWGDGPRTTDVFTTMLAGYDAGIFVIDPPRPDRCDPASFKPALDAIRAAARATGKPAFACASLPENLEESLEEALLAEAVVPLNGLEAGLAAIEAAATPAGEPGWQPLAALPPRKTQLLNEAAAKALLAGAGVGVPSGVFAPTLAALEPLIGQLTPPFALKGLGFAHKTEAGAVRLGLTSLAGQDEMPGATGYMAEEMVSGARAEVLIGLRRDPVYGIALTLGMGGVAAEVLADTMTLILPVTGDRIEAALRQLRLWPLLDGYRGQPGADIDALIRTALRLADLMTTRPEFEEIEINPLLICAEGAVAVDTLIRKETR